MRSAEDDEIHDYLMQLDKLREECERSGQFARAQECINRMREANLRYAKLIEKRSHENNSDAKIRLAEEHKLELLTFGRMWDEKMAEYDQRADALLIEVKMKHTQDFRDQEGMLKIQLMNKRPRFSKAVVDQRALLERCIQLRKYLEAEDVKRRLEAMERHEIASFDDSLAVTFERKIQSLKGQYVSELKAVEQKIKIGREELLTQRKIEFERLLKRHKNILSEIDQETKLHIAKTQRCVQRQVRALVRDPLKTGIDLRDVKSPIRDSGRSFASAPRNPTPRSSTRSVLVRGRRAMGDRSDNHVDPNRLYQHQTIEVPGVITPSVRDLERHYAL